MKNLQFDKNKFINAINTKLVDENITQYKLSLMLGINRANLLKIMRGTNKPSVTYFCKIAMWLNQPLESFTNNVQQANKIEQEEVA